MMLLNQPITEEFRDRGVYREIARLGKSFYKFMTYT
jgi:hypothetical protein